jgi:hypothetical protein
VVPSNGATLAAGDAVVTGDSSTAAPHVQRQAAGSQNPLMGAPQGGARMPRSS